MLGYFFDRAIPRWPPFLERQRADRMRRASEMADRLAGMGKPIDREKLLAQREEGRSLGRPMVAKALVTAGHVADVRQAFDQLIGEGKPAFIPQAGPDRVKWSASSRAQAASHPGASRAVETGRSHTGTGRRGTGGTGSISQRARFERDRALSDAGPALRDPRFRAPIFTENRSGTGQRSAPSDSPAGLFEQLSQRAGRKRSDGGGTADRDDRIGGRHCVRDHLG